MLTKSDREFILSANIESQNDLKEDLKKEFVTKVEMTKFKDEIVGRLDNIDQELVISKSLFGESLYLPLLR
jgi:hypothetical protein